MISELKSKMLELLKGDEEFRYAVAGLLGLEEILKDIRILQEQVASLQRQVVSLQEQVVEHSKVLREHSTRIDKLVLAVQGLEARWGILAEESFRSGMRRLVEEHFGGRVERWVYRDEEGYVFGHPSVVEVDLVAKDGEHILVEVKSSVSKADVSELWRVSRLYEEVEGVKPRLVVVSPYVDEKARETAGKLGIEVYTSL